MAEDNPPVRTQFASATSDDRFRAIFERAGVGLVLIDEHCKIFDTNQAFCDIVGRDRADLLGTSCMAITHPEDVPENERVIARLASPAEQTASFEKRYIRPDGQHIWVRINLTKIPFDEGERVLAVVEDISDRKVAEEQLRQSDDRLRLATDSAAIGTWDFNPETGELRWNERCKQLFGLPPDAEVTYDLFLAGLHPEDRERTDQAVQRALASDGPGEYDVQYRTIGLQDGVERWIAAKGRAMFEENGEGPRAVRFIGTVLDISDRIKAEQRLKRVLETDAVGVLFFNYDGFVVDANDAFLRMTGYSRDAIAQGKLHWRTMTPEEWVPASEEQMERFAATGRIGPYEKEYFLADGTRRWMLFAGRDLGDGTIAEYCLDITEGKRAAEALREEGHNLETLNRVGSALAGELDLERLVQMVTDAGVELTGARFGAFFYNVTNADGESYMLYTLSGADRSQFEKFGMPRNTKVFAPTFAGEGIVRSDDITRDSRYGRNPPHKGMPTGHLPVVSYLAVPVVGRTGEVIGGLFFGHPEPARFKERHERLMEGIAAQAAIAIDNARLFGEAQHEIEQRMKAEEALTALNETLESRVAEEIARRSHAEEALRQTQKMETVGQLSGGIAHDFNNLLQVIHGNLTLLQRALPRNEKQWQRSVANALTGTERAAALTQRLLAFSRRQPLDPKPVDLNGMIGEMIELLQRTLGETIRIGTRLAPDIPSALIDRNQLENALLNLAINARDAISGEGRLEIETSLAEPEHHPEGAAGSFVRMTVRDNGRGMSSDVLSRAIEPFFSTKEVGHGTGLGLSMVYGFIKQSGGHIELTSTEDEGTTVELFLPCTDAAAEAGDAAATMTELPQGCGERILVCEDDDDVRRFSSETLRDLGYHVIEAPNASAALELLGQNGGVDLLFTDVVLPGGKTGAELAREAQAMRPDLKVLFTTGYARSALDDHHDSGVQLLAKPFGVDELALRLRMMLDR
jgi:PAS domain S-box-containing protein